MRAVERAMMGLASGVISTALALAAPAAAEEPRTLQGAGPALTLEVTGPAGPSESFVVAGSLAAALGATPLEETVRLEDWPVAPGDRQTVEVTRHDVYAPDARVVAIGADGEVEVPRSPLLFFWGTAVGDPSRRALVSLDPATGTLGGLGVTPAGVFEILPVGSARRGEYRLASADEAPPKTGEAGEPGGGFVCGGSPTHPGDDGAAPEPAGAGLTTSVLSSLHTVTVAVDTDNELLSLKFGDSAAAATSYVAALVAGMNVIYERDLFVRLLQGHTVLRLSSAEDPWAQPSCPAWPSPCSSGGAGSAQLNEVSSYWASHYASVPRALTMVLSGKQSSASSASGIAWVNALCSGSYGYSFSQVFRFSGSTAASDVKLVGHEIGHNFGSRHTHCFPTPTTPIDTCYSGESGCYSGPTSCPSPFSIDPINGGTVSDVRGTIMSYCHLLGGCSASPVFHPQSVDVIAPLVDARVGVCVFADAGSATPTLSGVSPPGGPTTGGTTVTLTGSGFENGDTVTFVDATGSAAAATVTFVSGTSLTAVTPAHAAGATDVVVGSPRKRTATLSGGFTFATPAGALVSGTKTVAGSFAPGGAVVYTITLWNTGTGAQPDVGGSDELSDVLPSTLALVSASASAGTATATVATNTVAWNGTIGSDASVTVTIHATVKASTAGGTVVSNQGTVRYDGDGNGTNESAVPTDDPGRPGGADATSFEVGLAYHTLTPCRLADTRTSDAPALAAGSARTFPAAGRCGVPADAKALSLNVAVVAGGAPGNVVVYPGNLAAPTTSTVNFSAGQTRGNNAVVGLATNGAGSLAAKNRASAAVHLILDVNGYFR